MPPAAFQENVPAYASGWGNWDWVNPDTVCQVAIGSTPIPMWVWIVGGALAGIILADLGNRK